MEQLLTDWGFPDYVAKFIGRQYYCVCDVYTCIGLQFFFGSNKNLFDSNKKLIYTAKTLYLFQIKTLFDSNKLFI